MSSVRVHSKNRQPDVNAQVGGEAPLILGYVSRPELGRALRDRSEWLIGETLTRAADAADTLQLLAESSRRMHPATAYQVFTYATAAARAARTARDALPPPDPVAVGSVLEAGIGLGRSQTPIADLPAPLRPALSRLLVEARGFEPGVPPDRGELRAYGRVVTTGSAAVATILEQARGRQAARRKQAGAPPATGGLGSNGNCLTSQPSDAATPPP